MTKKGDILESYVHYVYDTLLNLKGRQVLVAQGAVISGKSGAPHQIDVYYEFSQAGVRHRVAIECKDTVRPVEKAEVGEFKSKLDDVGNVIGVMVSRAGYQSGAKTFAEHYGILLLTAEGLPDMLQLLAMRVKSTMLPDESFVGEPFWIPMDVTDGVFTGNYCTLPNRENPKVRIIPLFVSKVDAAYFAERRYEKGTYTVRGFPQHSLKALVGIAKLHGDIKFVMFFAPPPRPKMPWMREAIWTGEAMSPDDIAHKFIVS